MMLSIMTDLWEGFDARLTGPGAFRFYIQPLMAVALGIRDGLRDAHEGKSPYVIGVLFEKAHRKEELHSAFINTLIPFAIAFVLDLIYQWIIFDHLRLLGALMVGILLIAIPYILTRGLTNRIATLIRNTSAHKEIPT